MKSPEEIRERIAYLSADVGEVPPVVQAAVDCMVGELKWVLRD